MPPHTAKRRTTTNLKTKENQNCQNIELYGNLTTKELKKKYSSRLAGGVEMGNQVGRTCSKMVMRGLGCGEAAAGRPGEAVGVGPGSPTFACR